MNAMIACAVLLETIRSVQPSSGEWKVLVLDEASTRIISACCRMFDIMEEGVTLVENITKARQPMPTLDALYFITPSEDSIKRLSDDFRKASAPQYNEVHLIFTSHVSEELMSKLKTQVTLLQKVKTFKELNLEYLAFESRCFHFDAPETFADLYGGSEGSVQSKIVTKLLTTCITLGEFPSIRYQGGTLRAKRIADMLQSELENFQKKAPGFPAESDNRATLIIADRSCDLVSPFIHE
jgi:syntaxin-binding protein 1